MFRSQVCLSYLLEPRSGIDRLSGWSSNVDVDEDSCGQMSLICGLLRPQTQSQLKQSIASKSPSQPNPSVLVTRVLDLEEESMLHAETAYFADLSGGGQDSQSGGCQSNSKSNRSAATSPRQKRALTSVQPLNQIHALPSPSMRSSRRAVLTENTCPTRQVIDLGYPCDIV